MTTLFETAPFVKMNEEYLENLFKMQLTRLNFEIGVTNASELSPTEFTKSRAKGFGGSDAAVLLGVAFHTNKIPMKTKEALFSEKINEDFDLSISEFPSVRKGKELEHLILEKISKVLDATILKPKDSYIDYKTGLSMNFDGVIAEQIDENNFQLIPLEVKFCTTYGRGNYALTNGISEFEKDVKTKLKNMPTYNISFDPKRKLEMPIEIKSKADIIGIPPYYYSQLQDEIYFLGAPHGYMAVMDELKWEIIFFKVKRDDRVINELKKESQKLYIDLAGKKGLRIDLDDMDSDI